MDRFWSKVEKTDDCWVWTACRQADRRGLPSYGLFGVRGKNRSAHRVAWELTYGPIPSGAHVLHHCDNPPCVRPDHLFLGNQSVNILDMIAKGRQPPPQFGPVRRGELNPMAKLSDAQVQEIRSRYAGRYRQQSQLAREFGVTQSTIWRIVNHLVRATL